MKHHLENRRYTRHHLLSFALAIGLALPMPVLAASISLATSPLATSTTTSVLPNVFLMMDDSGSMGSAYMPDDAKSFSGNYGYASSQCNGVYYDPSITYLPPATSTGGSYANSSFTVAPDDGFTTGSSTTNLSTSFIDINSDGTTNDSGFSSQAAFYYKYSGTQTTNAQKDYYNTTSTFYKECNSAIGSTPGSPVFTKVTVSATSGPGATDERTNFANWYSYYRTRINMMKTATGLAFKPIGSTYRVGFATMNNNGGTDFINLKPFDSTQKTAWYKKLYDTSANHSTPLLGALADIGKMYAHKLTSKNGVTVDDPVEYSCQQNFTILSTDGFWNSRSGDTKLDGSTEVGNQDGTAGRPMYDGVQSADTVTTTYTRNNYSTSSSGLGNDANCPTSGSGKNKQYSKRMISQPQTRSCSVTAGVSTCTAWTSGSAVYVAPTYTSSTSTCTYSTITLPNPNPSAQQVSGTPVTTPGINVGTSNTLSDVAMYYYQTDLRTPGSAPGLNNCTGAKTGENVCTNNVFTSTSDNNTQQHMTTFTLGLGARGRMVYSSSYLNDTSGDYFSVKQGSTADSTQIPPVCSWQTDGTVCNWPTPDVAGTPENIDDLWHAAVDGRGAYFNATNPSSLSASLSNALAGINSRKGSAAAAATSTLNPVAGNNFAYVASYTTVTWKGNLEARGINVDTGVVSENATWCVENVPAGTCATTPVASTSGSTTTYNCVMPNAVVCNGGSMVGTDCLIPVATACSGTMNAQVADATDTRTILTANSTGTALVNFDAAYASANPTNFASAHISSLSQWTSLTAAQQTAAAGVNLINYLRGQHGYEDRTANPAANRLYRYREAVLGDALESQPAFIGSPVFSYPYPGYTSYKTAQANRAGTVYIGANDGMMHAFAADTGIESWAYVPSMVIPNMWKLADTNYATKHTNFVNGSPITTDVCTANCADAATAVWKTILVAGLNGGGRGYYALDITDPGAPALLWELKPTTGSPADPKDDIGYSFGQPVITRKDDGTWVVLITSGYNNTSPGDGKGYLYVLNAGTGAIISKIATGVGSTTTPSGLAKIAGWNNEPAGNKVGYVYGGDLQGNVWRFDINSIVPAAIGSGDVLKFATLFSDTLGANPQPVTTTPVLASVNTKRVIYIGTGQYLETGDLTTTQRQTQYAIMDNDAISTLVNPRNSLVPITLYNNPDGTATRLSSGSTVTFTNRGWYADFPDSGERVNIDSNLVQGILLVPSIVPSNTACSPGGYGWLNYFNYKTGYASSLKFDATIVGVNIIYVQGKPIVEVVTSTNPTPEQPSIQPPFQGSAGGFTSHRTIWRELIP